MREAIPLPIEIIITRSLFLTTRSTNVPITNPIISGATIRLLVIPVISADPVAEIDIHSMEITKIEDAKVDIPS